jgi:superfamily II DNA or RNA helicase
MILSEREDVKELRKLCWNCCIIDEVHGLPAAKVSEAFSKLKVNMKIGLTATPFR